MSKDFRRHGSHKLARLSSSWRKPRGLHNKVRLEKTGYTGKVKIGYGTKPTEELVVVSSKTDLEKVTVKTVTFSSKLGDRKKLDLLKVAKEKGITVVNVAADFDKKLEEKRAAVKKEQEARAKRKEARQKSMDKKKPKKEEKETLSDDEKKKQEKEQKDKVLQQGE